MFYASVVLIAVTFSSTAGLIVDPEWKIYYDLRTNQSIDTIDTSNPRQQLYRQYLKQLRIGFGPIPCSCQDLTCGCCAGMNITMLSFNRRACMNFTYDPMEFALNMNMLMDDESVLSQSVSAKNPPPVCLPAPLPPLFPPIDFCLRFFNVHTPGYNIFMCVDFETRMARAPLLVLHFDCMELGQDGISYHKPEEVDYEAGGATGGQDDIQIDVLEVYDEVIEDRNVTATQPTKSLLTGNRDTNRGDTAPKGEVYDEVVEDEEVDGTKKEDAAENMATTQSTTLPD